MARLKTVAQSSRVRVTPFRLVSARAGSGFCATGGQASARAPPERGLARAECAHPRAMCLVMNGAITTVDDQTHGGGAAGTTAVTRLRGRSTTRVGAVRAV